MISFIVSVPLAGERERENAYLIGPGDPQIGLNLVVLVDGAWGLHFPGHTL